MGITIIYLNGRIVIPISAVECDQYTAYLIFSFHTFFVNGKFTIMLYCKHINMANGYN